MFDRYNNLNPDYVPNNTTNYTTGEFATIGSEMPRPMYNLKGAIVGYTWNSEEKFDFNISIDDMITIKKNALIFEEHGAAPDTLTIGEVIGQQAYNVVDARSWTFVGKTNAQYIWVEDDELTYPTDGTKSIMIHTDMIGKHIEIDISDFRYQTVYSQVEAEGVSSTVLHVNDDLSNLLKSGIYHVSVKVCSDETTFVKNKFFISIA